MSKSAQECEKKGLEGSASGSAAEWVPEWELLPDTLESKGVEISTQRSRRSQRGAKEDIDRGWLATNTQNDSTV